MLGKPAAGEARKLTHNEANATGLTRNCLLYVTLAGELHILLRNAAGWKAIIEDEEWIRQQLEGFWSV